jgi:hypothetical protein
MATVVFIIGSLIVDALLVMIGTHLFPSTKRYVHFQFHGYAKLTLIGIVIACAAWRVLVRIGAEPRWLFLRLAVAVTVLPLLPDLYILHQGQTIRAVEFLMVTHVAIGVIPYNALVRITRGRQHQVNNRTLGSRLPAPVPVCKR